VLLPSTAINQPLAKRPTVVLQVAALAPPAVLTQPSPAASAALPGATSRIRPVIPAVRSNVSPPALQNALLFFQQQLHDMFANTHTHPHAHTAAAARHFAPLSRATVHSRRAPLFSVIFLHQNHCLYVMLIFTQVFTAEKLSLGLSIIADINKQVDILLDPDNYTYTRVHVRVRVHARVCACACACESAPVCVYTYIYTFEIHIYLYM
jgi:hypothetical protein